MKKFIFIICLSFICNTVFAEEWNCKFFGNLELIVFENRISEMSKEEQLELTKKLPMSPREHIVTRMIVEDVYSIKDFNMPVSEIKERGKKICETIK